ncbi:TlpA family protein disulfide reductase [Termitidicoccus mucosus]|uniref:Thioredoxin domain-containing protein n=1 Tax=Termitidicoccus mucosus TaxID=1184151 RepID=A0A178IF44_9BACT|nr:hypothetical protein AW736_20650 [Opitutaceae bacterium TSB47]
MKTKQLFPVWAGACLAVLSSMSISRAETPPGTAGEPAVSSSTAADRDYAELENLLKAAPPEGIDPRGREGWLWREEKYKRYAVGTLAFYKNHPSDPRRWEGIVQRGYTSPSFITGFKPGFDENPSWGGLIADEAALAEFRAGQTALLRELELASDTTLHQRIGAAGWLFDAVKREAVQNPSGETRERLRVAVKDFMAKFEPELNAAEIAGSVAESFLDLLREQDASAAAEYEETLRRSRHASLREVADKEARALARLAGAGKIKFTAADGREVDVGAMRGKVVLIDFWATWCGPCIAEIPNVVAVYDKYHDKGFEVVGITLENTGVTATMEEAQKEKRLAAAKAKMLKFAADKKMPWPQHYDGKGFGNDFAVQFGIQAIPAMVLIAPDGTIVSTSARGPKLESEVRRLLGLE